SCAAPGGCAVEVTGRVENETVGWVSPVRASDECVQQFECPLNISAVPFGHQLEDGTAADIGEHTGAAAVLPCGSIQVAILIRYEPSCRKSPIAGPCEAV